MAGIGEDVKEINKYLLGVIRAEDELALIKKEEAEIIAKLSSSSEQNVGGAEAGSGGREPSASARGSEDNPQPPDIPMARFEEFLSRFRE